MFDDKGIGLSAPGEFTIELFVPWIHKIMLVYHDHEASEKDGFLPENTMFSKAYYMKS